MRSLYDVVLGSLLQELIDLYPRVVLKYEPVYFCLLRAGFMLQPGNPDASVHAGILA